MSFFGSSWNEDDYEDDGPMFGSQGRREEWEEAKRLASDPDVKLHLLSDRQQELIEKIKNKGIR
jgi:hypothetical protein